MKDIQTLRDENPIFDDLCDARDDVIRVMNVHSVSLDALRTELKAWDKRVTMMYGKLRNE